MNQIIFQNDKHHIPLVAVVCSETGKLWSGGSIPFTIPTTVPVVLLSSGVEKPGVYGLPTELSM